MDKYIHQSFLYILKYLFKNIYIIRTYHLFKMSTSTQNIDQVSNEVKPSAENQPMPTWQDIANAIKEIIIVADYYGKPRDGKLMQGHKKQYRNLFNTEEPDEYIVEY